MKQEDYVTYETAKLLKEKGFKEPCGSIYLHGEIVEFDNRCYPNDWNSPPLVSELNIYISAPLLSQATKWLRESNQIWVKVFPKYDKRYELVVYRIRITTYDNLLENQKGRILPLWFGKYGQALDEGIKEALKYI